MISSLNSNPLKFSALVFERYPSEEVVVGHQVTIKVLRKSTNDGAEVAIKAPYGVWVRNIGENKHHAGPKGDTFTAIVRRVVDKKNRKAVVPTVEIGFDDPVTGKEMSLAKLVAPTSKKTNAIKLGFVAPPAVQVDRAEVYRDKINAAITEQLLTLDAMSQYVRPTKSRLSSRSDLRL